MVTQTQQQHLNQRFHSLCEDAIKIKRTKEQWKIIHCLLYSLNTKNWRLFQHFRINNQQLKMKKCQWMSTNTYRARIQFFDKYFILKTIYHLCKLCGRSITGDPPSNSRLEAQSYTNLELKTMLQRWIFKWNSLVECSLFDVLMIWWSWKKKRSLSKMEIFKGSNNFPQT